MHHAPCISPIRVATILSGYRASSHLLLKTGYGKLLLFSNPTWSGGHAVPSSIIKNITANTGQLAYSEQLTDNITTLSSSYASSGILQGLLYVPDLKSDDPCQAMVNDYIPQNVTRRANLPATNYNLIALVPWISAGCMESFFNEARSDPLRGMLVYLPDGDSAQPPHESSSVWDIGDGDAWKTIDHYPVYAIPGASGAGMMRQLSLYSGDLSRVPFGQQINETYSPNPADYVRVWAELSVVSREPPLQLWSFFLIIIAVLLVVIGGTSLLMHCVQNRRRSSLRRRVMSGEVNLEALGIKRLTVPGDHVETFPLFTYNYDPPVSSPTSSKFPRSSVIKGPSEVDSKATTFKDPKASYPLDYQPACLICLDDFESKVTIIRELPCGHIFHPDCIDEFLSELSSLCPLCKTSLLPAGYCPKITNSMVRKEFGTRRLRLPNSSFPDLERGRRRLSSWGSSLKKHISRKPSTREPPQNIMLHERPATRRPSAAATTRQRMEEFAPPIDETNSDDGRPQWKRATFRVFPGFR
ncbi:hypothetical protein F4778DRAFT_769436 [Xylariomycetidae sp. FL2044]|nr:hypothetical protein F4778DRAFT_769436 [Xylariomycetidae sp. FL2044]